MADVEAKVDKLCRGMLLMAQQGDTTRATSAAKLLREVIRELELQGGERPEMFEKGDELREALKGVIVLLKPLLATPDEIAEEYSFRCAELNVAVSNFIAALPAPDDDDEPAVPTTPLIPPAPGLALAPVPAPPPKAAVNYVDPRELGLPDDVPAARGSSGVEASAVDEVILAARSSGSDAPPRPVIPPVSLNIPPFEQFGLLPPVSVSPRSAPTAGPGSPRANLTQSAPPILTPGPGSPRVPPTVVRPNAEEIKKASQEKLAATISEEHPLVALHSLLMEHDGLELVNLLAGAIPASHNDFDELATSLTLCFAHAQADLELLQYFIKIEVPKCTAEATLFRGADFASKLISAFGRTWAAPYLFATLDPCFEEVTANKFDYEVDPNRLSFGIDIKKNQSRLTALCIRAVEDILKSAKNFPVPLKALYAMTQAIVVDKFPKMKYTILGGLFFLRLLCPALIAPEAAGLRKVPEERAKRALLLLSKFLQNMGNDVLFAQKEAFMCFLNDVLRAERDRLHKFFDELVDLPQGELEPANPHLTDDLVLRSLAAVRRIFTANLPKVKAALAAMKDAPPSLNTAFARLEANLAMPFNDAAAFPAGLLQATKELAAKALQEEKDAHAAELEALREARRCIRSMSNVDVLRQLQMNNLPIGGGNPIPMNGAPMPAGKSNSGRGQPAAAAAPPAAAKAKPKGPVKPPTADEAAKMAQKGCWVYVIYKGKKWDHRLCFMLEGVLHFYNSHKEPAPTYSIKLDKWAHIELPTKESERPNSLAITGPAGNFMLAFSTVQDMHSWRKAMEANQKEFLKKV